MEIASKQNPFPPPPPVPLPDFFVPHFTSFWLFPSQVPASRLLLAAASAAMYARAEVPCTKGYLPGTFMPLASCLAVHVPSKTPQTQTSSKSSAGTCGGSKLFASLGHVVKISPALADWPGGLCQDTRNPRHRLLPTRRCLSLR